MADHDDLAHLQRFILENRELELLEAALDDFNPFVAMGWTRQEARHSYFLRWLLDPRETHGLGPYFLRLFLKQVASRSNPTTLAPSVFELDNAPLSSATVQTEWNGVDVFIRDDADGIVCAIENKVDAVEHSEQLARYREAVEQQFPTHKKLFVFLTVGGDEPSDSAYVIVKHSDVVGLIRETVRRRKDQIGAEVAEFLVAYAKMVERHIMEDSELQRICEQIYSAHRRALDLLFEYRPDRLSELHDCMADLVASEGSVVADHSTKAYVRFEPTGLEFLPRLGRGWTPSGRLILCEMDMSGGALYLKIILGPGPASARERINAVIQQHPAQFNRAKTKLYPQWWSFHTEMWANKAAVENTDVPALKGVMRSHFENFVKSKLPQFIAVLDELRAERWEGPTP